MKTISRAGVSLVTALTLACAAGGSAFAQESPVAGASAEDAALVTAFFDELGIADAETAEVVDAFDVLSADEQAAVVATIEGDSPMDIFTFGEEVVTTSSTAPRSQSARAAAAATTYEVTSNYKVPVEALGITFGSFNLQYKYQTGSNKVLKDYSCTAWRSGIAGYWSYSNTTNHWVTGGIGNCVALFTGSLVYKGSAITQNKEMGMTVDGPGIRSTWIKAV